MSVQTAGRTIRSTPACFLHFCGMTVLSMRLAGRCWWRATDAPIQVLRDFIFFGVLLLAVVHAAAADPGNPVKVLHVTQQAISPGPIDPAQVNSIFGANIIDNLFEPMLQYDYLARPLKLVPLTLREMPEEREEGRVYVCRLKPGIYFADDPAFKGRQRELTAADYAYSFRRLFDPKYRSSQYFMVDGKIAGANALRDAAAKTGKFDYDTPIRGLQVLDRYTLRITLTEPDLNFLHVLAQQNLAAVAREAVETYGDDIHLHPVGTGPFHVVEWQQGQRMVFERNPHFHGETFAADPGSDPEASVIARRLAGRALPMVDRVELYFTVENQPMWLSFVSGELDMLVSIPVAFRPGAVPQGKLAPNLARRD